MHLEYTLENVHSVACHAFTHSDMQTLIGTAEGYLGANNELVTVIKVSEEFMCKGYGYRLFTEVFQYIADRDVIHSVIGSWSKHAEFSYCENGQSTNLSVFQQLKEKGFTDAEAAFCTPTGKWAKRIGFDNVTFHMIKDHEIKVEFTKN